MTLENIERIKYVNFHDFFLDKQLKASVINLETGYADVYDNSVELLFETKYQNYTIDEVKYDFNKGMVYFWVSSI